MRGKPFRAGEPGWSEQIDRVWVARDAHTTSAEDFTIPIHFDDFRRAAKDVTIRRHDEWPFLDLSDAERLDSKSRVDRTGTETLAEDA